jgi:hypothetical protein
MCSIIETSNINYHYKDQTVVTYADKSSCDILGLCMWDLPGKHICTGFHQYGILRYIVSTTNLI